MAFVNGRLFSFLLLGHFLQVKTPDHVGSSKFLELFDENKDGSLVDCQADKHCSDPWSGFWEQPSALLEDFILCNIHLTKGRRVCSSLCCPSTKYGNEME